jgi:hypothetical protein
VAWDWRSIKEELSQAQVPPTVFVHVSGPPRVVATPQGDVRSRDCNATGSFWPIQAYTSISPLILAAHMHYRGSGRSR